MTIGQDGDNERWFVAFEPIVTLSAARHHGVPLDTDEVLDGYDKTDVIEALIDLTGRFLGILPDDAVDDVLRGWGTVVATRGAVCPRPPSLTEPETRP